MRVYNVPKCRQAKSYLIQTALLVIMSQDGFLEETKMMVP